MSTQVHGGNMDSTSIVSAAVSIGGAAVGQIAPHPMQYIVWVVAIIAGIVSIIAGLRNMTRGRK